MRTAVSLVFVAVCVWAENSADRRKVPFVVDAIGNTLPPPSKVPAAVGSPVKLLTPDRYEFYTFDESGELVKRLMTLEEIQEIVAAGDDTEGLVTFANNNQPTIMFNFTQPSSTKVHSVVANVQNVLKAQIEAHKNQPQIRPTLDTPDVSDSWSLILPSIFGNSGVDMGSDKNFETYAFPETDMIDSEQENTENEKNNNEQYLSKEGENHLQILSATTKSGHATETPFAKDDTKIIPSTTIHSTTSTTSTRKPITSLSTTTTLTTRRPTTTLKTITTTKITAKPTTTKITAKPTTTIIKPITITTKEPIFSPSTTVKTYVSATTKIDAISKATTLGPLTSNKSVSKLSSATNTSTVKPSTLVTKSSEIPPSTDFDTFVQMSSISPIQYLTNYPEKVMNVSTLATIKPIHVVPTTIKTATSNKPTVAATTKPLKINKTDQVFSTTVKPLIKPVYDNLKINATLLSTNNLTQLNKTIVNTNFSVIIENLEVSTKKMDPLSYTQDSKKNTKINSTQIPTNANDIKYEKISTFTPAPTILSVSPIYNSLPTTRKASTTTSRTDIDFITSSSIDSIPSYKPPLNLKENSTITLQNYTEVTIVSSTLSPTANEKPILEDYNISTSESISPMFDVALSISQIASDLGGNYLKVPTSINLLNSPKPENINLESKENIEIDIPADNKNETMDNFIKISTFDPNLKNQYEHNPIENDSNDESHIVTENLTDLITSQIHNTTVDPIVSESMGDLLSQVVNETPQIPKKELPPQESPEKLIAVSTSESKDINKKTDVFHTNTTIKNNQTIVKILPSNVKIEKYNSSTLSFTAENSSLVNNDTLTYTKTELNQSINPELTFYNVDKTHLKEETPINDQFSNLTNVIHNINNSLYGYSEFNVRDSSTQRNVDDRDNGGLIKFDDFKKKIQKVNIDDKEFEHIKNNSWKLISTVTPPKVVQVPKDKFKVESQYFPESELKDINLEFPKENQGLEVTTKDLEEDIAQFTDLCNELAFRYWNTVVAKIDKRRSFILSPYSITSMLAMIFMGAKGATSGEMNEVLKLDDMVTFNPHFTLKNISDSIEISSNSGVSVSAFIRELYSDKNKGKILTFYKERAQHFYNGHVEEINFKLISDIIRRRTNLLVKRYTWGKIQEHMKSNSITMQAPLAAFSTNIFQTDCTGTSVEGRDGEMYFVVSPNVRQRRLVPVPAVVYKNSFLAGYDPVLDATTAALGNIHSIVSVLFLMPGQQGNVVNSEDLEALERRLLDINPTTPTWNRLLRTLLPRIGLELQIPRFSHKSIFNVSSSLKTMGLKELFDSTRADLGGLNGPSKDLHLSDMIQSSSFATCGEGTIGEQHHVEEYPDTIEITRRRRTLRWANDWDEPRDYQRAFHDPHDVGDAMNLPLHLRPRQARVPARNAQVARLKFDRPFLYFVRHNPTGMILYVGRYNPRLLP